jgi:hypothetical protein
MTLDDAVIQRALAPLGISNVRFAKTRADLQATHLGSTSNYDPAWVYHGLLIGPISQAALFLDRLLSAELLCAGLLQEMQTARTLGSVRKVGERRSGEAKTGEEAESTCCK